MSLAVGRNCSRTSFQVLLDRGLADWKIEIVFSLEALSKVAYGKS